jgi:very-short-patch-repair endonuclease
MATRRMWNLNAVPAGWNSLRQRKGLQPAMTALLERSSNGIPRLVPNSGLSPALSPTAESLRTAIGSSPSSLEAAYARIMRALKFPTPTREFRFDPIRKWRFDFAWPDQKVAVELDGGIWTKGGHSTGTGIMRDMEKSNQAQLDGWLVLRFSDKHLEDGSAIEQTKRALGLA